jgi:hypothetical protein
MGHITLHTKSCFLKKLHFFTLLPSEAQVLSPQGIHFLNIIKNHPNDMFSSGTYVHLLEGLK